jgi:hypothetical protein
LPGNRIAPTAEARVIKKHRGTHGTKDSRKIVHTIAIIQLLPSVADSSLSGIKGHPAALVVAGYFEIQLAKKKTRSYKREQDGDNEDDKYQGHALGVFQDTSHRSLGSALVRKR